MTYLNSVKIIGFVGADPQQRQLPKSGAKFTVLSVATRGFWKNAEGQWSSKTEWHRIAIFRPRLAEYVAMSIKKRSHVLVEGSLVSSRSNAQSNESKAAKVTSWSIRADVVRKLDRDESEPEATASGSAAVVEAAEALQATPF